MGHNEFVPNSLIFGIPHKLPRFHFIILISTGVGFCISNTFFWVLISRAYESRITSISCFNTHSDDTSLLQHTLNEHVAHTRSIYLHLTKESMYLRMLSYRSSLWARIPWKKPARLHISSGKKKPHRRWKSHIASWLSCAVAVLSGILGGDRPRWQCAPTQQWKWTKDGWNNI